MNIPLLNLLYIPLISFIFIPYRLLPEHPLAAFFFTSVKAKFSQPYLTSLHAIIPNHFGRRQQLNFFWLLQQTAICDLVRTTNRANYDNLHCRTSFRVYSCLYVNANFILQQGRIAITSSFHCEERNDEAIL